MVANLHLESCTDQVWDQMHEDEYLGDWMGCMLELYLFRGSCQLCMPSN